MELRIFNYRMLAIVVSLAISSAAFAQARPATPQTPQTPATEQTGSDANRDARQSRRDAQREERDVVRIQVKANAKKIERLARRLGQKFKETFKDLSASLNDLGPEMDEVVNDIDVKVNTNVNNYNGNDRDNDAQMIEKVKNYTKTYPADGNDVLSIDNQFGKVTVNTWNRNEFKVDVQMKFSMDDEDEANNLMNGTTVSDSKSGSTVSFRTRVYDGSSRRSKNRNITINYMVYMPVSNSLQVNNRFGGVVLPDLSGQTSVRLSYGNLTAGNLSNSQNDVVVKFGEANISGFNKGRLSVSYGKLKAGTVNVLDADISFASISVDRLKTSADVKVRYGDGFRIGTVDRSVKNISVDAAYTKINLNLSDLSYDFDVTTRYGSFDYDDDRLKITSKSPSDEERGWSSTKSYKGHTGKSGADSKVTINASFTGVSFNN